MSSQPVQPLRRERRAAALAQKRAGTRPAHEPRRIGIGAVSVVALVAGLALVGAILFFNQPKVAPVSVSPASAPAGIPSTGHILGNAAAPVTIDLFEDFQCPACSQWGQNVFPTLAHNELASGRAKIVFHAFAFIGQESKDAGRAAWAAEQQGRFWDMWATLYANQGLHENGGAFTRDRLLAMADTLGLDATRFAADFDSADATAFVSQGMRRGRQGRASTRHRPSSSTAARSPATDTPTFPRRSPRRRRDRPRVRLAPPARHPPRPRPRDARPHRARHRVLPRLGRAARRAPELRPAPRLRGGRALQYSRIGGVPVAVFGVALSLVLLRLAIAWWRTNDGRLLAAHYGLSLLGVVFELYFTYLELFVIGAICVWCATAGSASSRASSSRSGSGSTANGTSSPRPERRLPRVEAQSPQIDRGPVTTPGAVAQPATGVRRAPACWTASTSWRVEAGFARKTAPRRTISWTSRVSAV